MNFFITQCFDPFVLVWMLTSFILNLSAILFWREKIYLKFGFKNYKGVQRIHLDETPRLAGFVFIISLAGFEFFSKNSESSLFLRLIFPCLIPIIIVALKEDLFHNVSPLIRLFSLAFVGWLFMIEYLGPLPDLSNIQLVNNFLLLKYGPSIFYITSIVVIANGMNLIDGVNGLCGMVALSIFTALLLLSYEMNDIIMLSAISSAMLLLIPFILLNYPFGLIFLGDLGAYSLGLIVSIFTIIFFGRHPEISPWLAVLILIFPASEAIFSLFRRLIYGHPISSPDALHLHLKIFYFFSSNLKYKKIANALVMPFLSILWLIPPLTVGWIYNNPIFIFNAIIIFIIIYSVLYFSFFIIQKNITRKN
jgi:UDP-GlcNAc:undecaprenyl-phosphate GlcNAc-1-phosphate transferase